MSGMSGLVFDRPSVDSLVDVDVLAVLRQKAPEEIREIERRLEEIEKERLEKIRRRNALTAALNAIASAEGRPLGAPPVVLENHTK